MTIMQIHNVEEHKNHVSFELDDLVVLYERLGNTIHTGTREELEPIVTWLNEQSYSPEFSSERIKEMAHEHSQLVLNVTESCNMACRYCIYSGKYCGERVNSPCGQRMSIETALKAVDYFSSIAKDGAAVGFYGGEPTLEIELIKGVVEYVKSTYPEKGFTFSFTSNFLSVAPHLQYLIDNEFYLAISIDGPSKIHDSMRVDQGGKGTYNRVISNIIELRSLNPEYFRHHVGFSAVYTRGCDLAEIVDFFMDDKLFTDGRIVLLPAERSLLKDPSEFGDAESKKAAEAVEELTDIYIDNIVSGRQNPPLLRNFFDMDLIPIYRRDHSYMPDRLSPGGTCYPGARKIFVNTNGTFHICEKMGLRHPLGSVDDGLDFERIDALLDEYLVIKNSTCRDCWAARLCSTCALSCKGPEGLSENALKTRCGPIKEGLVHALGMYVTLARQDHEKNHISYFSEIELA